MSTLDLTTAPEIVRKGHATLGRLANMHAPVIAAINGLAVGGGLELALCPDLMAALARRVSVLAGDPKVRAVILSGEGQFFSAGAEL